ncbi:phosphopantetheine-binding protein [Pedobacter roseus]|uniref:Carrier domain-containing protein n=1 Tax=Pedobacter roseus TaxID=336820 RepID=A0A7G9QKR6_9SPHI|nr:phosphopantetheine-binding protein [Pedobacter roseus]QNN43941.1 hypothetical protein H9L23_07635 [Pedobacter roseus]
MVPGHYVGLASLPLTPNGKVDRRSLPDPERLELGSGREYIAPRTETERALVSIWQDVLGKEGIGVKDNFFELGGNSLSILKIIIKLRNRFRIEVNFNEILVYPVLDEFARKIEIQFWLKNTNDTNSLTSDNERFIF